jgi:GTPase
MSETSAGTIAILGAPNAGKSTLLNRLVGTKLAIVSPKVQTTRSRLLGIALRGTAQLIFIDTPGIFAPKRALDRAMVAAAWMGAREADAVVLVVDAARGLDGDTERILEGLQGGKTYTVLALNKIDRVERAGLLPLAAELGKRRVFDAVFMISSTTGDGVEDMAAHLAQHLPAGPWLFPEDQITDAPMRLLAAELVREQVFLQLHQELPYAVTVATDEYLERKDGSVRISATVHVARESHRPIVLGKGGAQIKRIGAAARVEIARLVGRPVHLFLHVKLSERWAEDREHYAAMHLDYEK